MSRTYCSTMKSITSETHEHKLYHYC